MDGRRKLGICFFTLGEIASSGSHQEGGKGGVLDVFGREILDLLIDRKGSP